LKGRRKKSSVRNAARNAPGNSTEAAEAIAIANAEQELREKEDKVRKHYTTI
jgi:hypothetical protein